MKKKHFKLLTTMASLLLVVSVMAVGIWAATQQAFKLSSNITFTATGIQANIYAKVSGDVEGSATIGGTPMAADSYALLKEFKAAEGAHTSADPITQQLVYGFHDKGDGFIAPTGTESEEVVVSLLIVNADANIDLFYHILPYIDLDNDADSEIQIKSATIQTGTVDSLSTPVFTGAAESTATGITAKNNTANTEALAGAGAEQTAYNAVEVVITLATNHSVTAITGDTGFTVDIDLKNVAIDMTSDPELTWNQTWTDPEGND